MTNDPQVERTDKDIFRLSDEMDADTVRTIADRLEFRATDPGYVAVSEAYFSELPLSTASRVLTIGCGTGVEVRSLRKLMSSDGLVTGIDQSETLIEIARRLTSEAGFDDGVEYAVGDAHRMDFAEETFDVTVLHTLVSHVDDPIGVLREARRVTKVGGTVAVFDGDYASITFGYPDDRVESEIEAALMKALIANPRIMRDMPRLIEETSLELVSASGQLYADIGSGAFWANVPESYAGILSASRDVDPAVVEEWRAYQARAVAENKFFGASNYYSYLMIRPG